VTEKPAVGQGTLTVRSVPTSITLTLSDYDILAGETTTATVVDQNGQDITDLCMLSIESGAGGAWGVAPDTNVYTSERAGTWAVTAIYGSLVSSADLTVDPAAAVSLELDPVTATINSGDAVTYAVEATDGFGNTWSPSTVTWNENGAGSFGVGDNTYTSTALDAGNVVTVTATLGAASDVATISVNPLDGPGLILAWDKDTRNFYLCANPANPQTGRLVDVTKVYDVTGDDDGDLDVPVVVSGTATNRSVSVTIAGVTNSLQVRYYLRSGALLYVYMYSRIGTTLQTATYRGPLYGDQTFVDGEYKDGFWGLIHTLDAKPPTSIAYGAALQPAGGL